MAQTIEQRIAEIAQGFGQGIQNYQAQADRQRAIALQDEARRRQQALQALEVSNQIGTSTGRFIEPSIVAPMVQTGDFSGLGSMLEQAPLTREAELRQMQLQRQAELDQLNRDYKQARINEMGRSKGVPTSKMTPDEKIEFKVKEQKALVEAGLKPEAKKDNITADMRKAATFAERVEQSEKVFNELSSQGFDRSSLGSMAQSYLPNALKSEALKRQDQAERNFVNAILRRESGASINQPEFQSAEVQYFDREGDTPQVKEQKRQNRLTALAGLKAEAGEKAISQIRQAQPQSQVSQQPAFDPNEAAKELARRRGAQR